MSEGELKGILKRGYGVIFYENWPIWLSGIIIGILSVLCFAWGRPWGVAGGLKNWGDWIFYGLGIYSKSPEPFFQSTNSLLTLGLLWGAFGASLMSKEFAIRFAPKWELLKGCVGGIIMGVGSAMAGGCNVGGFFSATSALSLSGLLMMIGLFVGAYLGLRYLYWELEHISTGQGGAASTSGGQAVQPYLGALVLLGSIVFAYLYAQEALTRQGVLLLFGVAFGITIQRARFCFVRGFRDIFMTAEAEIPKGITFAILISILGFAILKWAGLRGEEVYVPQAFWFGALVGGIIFGFGMVIAGGCGSGSVWRAGEGQVKLMLAVLFFALSTSLTENWINNSERLLKLMGTSVFLPNYLGYFWTVVVLCLFFLLYIIVAVWNEKTEKFLVEP